MLEDLDKDTVDFQPNYDARARSRSSCRALPEPAVQRLDRHRGRHGDEPAAAQPRRDLRRDIALVNRQPRTLGLKELIECYIDHRVVVIRRRTQHLLREAKKRAHVLEGMIYAVWTSTRSSLIRPARPAKKPSRS
jgi:DNA gyrase/topoisomerase IV subunit A